MQLTPLELAGEAGFSLIELVLAMGVIGIVLVPIISGYSLSLKSLKYSKNRQVATMLGKECIARLRSTVPFSDLPTTGSSVSCDGSTGTNPYTFEPPNTDYEYDSDVQEVSNSGGLVLKQIRLRIYFPSPFKADKSCITDRDCNSWDFTAMVAQR